MHLISVNAEAFKAIIKDMLTSAMELPHAETRDKVTLSTEILDSFRAGSTEARSEPNAMAYISSVQKKYGFCRDAQPHPRLLSTRVF